MLKVTLPPKLVLELAPVIEKLVSDKLASEISKKNATLWGKDSESEASIRLGWVNSASDSEKFVSDILALKAQLNAKGIDRIVLCGMGGSSLAPEVITKTYGVALEVLDSTDPDQVRMVTSKDLARTAVVVSSKSGSTVETDSQKRIFEQLFTANGIDKTERIIVVTDPGSPMEKAALEDGYRVFNADPTVGGRYSALTAFGMVPSGLAGANMKELLAQAQQAESSLVKDALDNPGLVLGAAMARTKSSSGFKDKIGIISDESTLPDFADWAEQLIAESTGKQEHGVLPVVLSESSFETNAVINDLLLAEVSTEEFLNGSNRIQVQGSLGEQFMLWEYATVIASRLIGINPFDQPDVESAKIAARGMLEQKAAVIPNAFTVGNISVRAEGFSLPVGEDVATSLRTLIAQLTSTGYLSIQAYLNRKANLPVSVLREKLAEKTKRPTTFGWAPRFLHSTGQYHKGGPRNGVYLQLVSKDQVDLMVPGRDFSFGELIASQAAGDARVLADLGRPVLTLTLSDPEKDIQTLINLIG